MTDERGGKYLKEARFFLVGDKAAAQSHIPDARNLLGQIRDSCSHGGPETQVRYGILRDGTTIKAVKMGALYQAEIVSRPIQTPLELPKAGKVVFIFEGSTPYHGIYDPRKDEFRVIDALVYSFYDYDIGNTTRRYTAHTNYWYGAKKDEALGVTASVERVGTVGQESLVWSGGEMFNQCRAYASYDIFGGSVWDNWLIAAEVSQYWNVWPRIQTVDEGVTVPSPPTYDKDTVLLAGSPGAKFSPDGKQAVMLNDSTSYQVMTVSSVDNPPVGQPAYSVAYSTVYPTLETTVYTNTTSDPVYTSDTDDDGCGNITTTSSTTYGVTPGEYISASLLAVGFGHTGQVLALTQHNATHSTPTPGSSVSHSVQTISGSTTYTIGNDLFCHWDYTGPYILTRNASITNTSSTYAEVSTSSYKVNGVVVYAFTDGYTQTPTVGWTNVAQVGLQPVSDACGGSRVCVVTDPIPPPDIYSYNITSGVTDGTTTYYGETGGLLWYDLRSHVFVFWKSAVGPAGTTVNPKILFAVTRTGTYTIHVPTDYSSSGYAVKGAAYFDTALFYVTAGPSGALPGFHQTFVIHAGGGVEDVTSRIPLGWLPTSITLCVDEGLVYADIPPT